MNETNKEEKLLKYIGELAVQIENLKAENEKLERYKNLIEKLKTEGFDTLEFLKNELTAYKEYRLKVAQREIK